MLLDVRLESSSSFITNLSLCQVRLSHNAAFPWLLLIPNKASITEIIDLSPSEQQTLMQEISFASEVMYRLFTPDKLNVAALGNVVPQLHIHIIARYKTDPVWPDPVWKTVDFPYGESAKKQLIDKISMALTKAQLTEQ